MDSTKNNLLHSTAREALNEYRSPTNKLSYREILNKHAVKIAPCWPDEPPAWLRLSCACMRVIAGK